MGAGPGSGPQNYTAADPQLPADYDSYSRVSREVRFQSKLFSGNPLCAAARHQSTAQWEVRKGFWDLARKLGEAADWPGGPMRWSAVCNIHCSTHQTVGLLGTGAAARAEQVAALARLGPEAAAGVALRRAVYLGELLAVVGTLAPAPLLQHTQSLPRIVVHQNCLVLCIMY